MHKKERFAQIAQKKLQIIAQNLLHFMRKRCAKVRKKNSIISWKLQHCTLRALVIYLTYHVVIVLFRNIKGTVSVIASDLPFIKRHVWITTVPFQPLSGQWWGIHPHLYSWRLSEVPVYTTKSLIRLRFKGIVVNRTCNNWKVTWNYTHSPFK